MFKDPLFYAMACVIAFGLALGTVLSLLVVPVIYALFFKVTAPPRTRTPAASAPAEAPPATA